MPPIRAASARLTLAERNHVEALERQDDTKAAREMAAIREAKSALEFFDLIGVVDKPHGPEGHAQRHAVELVLDVFRRSGQWD